MSGSPRRSGFRARLHGLTLLCSLVLLLVSPASTASASTGTGGTHTGVHGLTTVLRAGTTGIDVFISWAPPTAEQRRGLTWTSVYFGDNPQPILVFPPETDVTVPDVSPGTYRLGVEFDYGPRSSYTRSARHRLSVTVPEALPIPPSASAATASGPSPVAASRQPTGTSWARRVQGGGSGTLLVAVLIAAGLLVVSGGVRGVRRRRRRAS